MDREQMTEKVVGVVEYIQEKCEDILDEYNHDGNTISEALHKLEYIINECNDAINLIVDFYANNATEDEDYE